MDQRTQELFDKAAKLRADMQAMVERLWDRQCEIFERQAKQEHAQALIRSAWRAKHWPKPPA